MRRFRLQKPAREHSPLKIREWDESKEDEADVRRILEGKRPLIRKPPPIVGEFPTVD